MSVSDKIPSQIEELLMTNRRGFLKSAGLLAVSFGFAGAGLTGGQWARPGRRRSQVPIRILIFTKSTRGS